MRPKTIRLYSRPPSFRNVDLTKLPIATSLDDRPFGVLQLPHGAEVFFAIIRDRDGRLLLNVVGMPKSASARVG